MKIISMSREKYLSYVDALTEAITFLKGKQAIMFMTIHSDDEEDCLILVVNKFGVRVGDRDGSSFSARAHFPHYHPIDFFEKFVKEVNK